MFFSMLFYLSSFILIISVIVFVHEFGHYFFAKIFGVKIETFSIGFGPEVFGFNDSSGTRWKLSLIPAGGYVRLFGDFNEASVPDRDALANMNDKERVFAMHFKPLYQKALIVFGGPLSNLLFAFLILSFFFVFFGKPFVEPVVTLVREGSVAQKADIRVGDKIIAIDGKKVDWFGDIKHIIAVNTGTEVEILYLRDNEKKIVKLIPSIVKSRDFLGNDVDMPQLGIMSDKMVYKNLTFISSMYYALSEMHDIISSTLKIMGQMILGKRDTSSLGGPIKIAKYSGQSLRQGVFTVFWFLAMISINLGVVNLFPIPLLDGGHLFFYLIELIKGPATAMRYHQYSSKISMLFLAALFLFVTINDIKNLIK